MSATLLQTTSLAPSAAARTTTTTLWAGRVATGIAVVFLGFDTAIKLVQAKFAVAATMHLGFAPHHVVEIGLVELACLVLYLMPRTAAIGAVLWTGYLGGAIAAHLRLDDPLVGYVLFPTYVAALLWGGLYTRDARVRALFRSAR
jgi:hypothetical protein